MQFALVTRRPEVLAAKCSAMWERRGEKACHLGRAGLKNATNTARLPSRRDVRFRGDTSCT